MSLLIQVILNGMAILVLKNKKYEFQIWRTPKESFTNFLQIAWLFCWVGLISSVIKNDHQWRMTVEISHQNSALVTEDGSLPS